MKKKNATLSLSAGIITFILGLVYFLSASSIASPEIIEYWYEALFVYAAAIAIAIAVSKKAPLYYLFAFTLGGTFLYLILSRLAGDFSLWWPLIFSGAGCGLFASAIFGKGKFRWKSAGLLLVMFSVILLCGSLTNYLGLCASVCVLLLSFVIGAGAFKRNKKTEDEYVEPSKDKKKE